MRNTHFTKAELDAYKEAFYQELLRIAPDWGEQTCREEADNVPYSCWAKWKGYGVRAEQLAWEATL